VFARLHRETGLHGVFRARHQFWLGGSENHLYYFTEDL